MKATLCLWKNMRYIKKTSGIKNIFTVYITVPRRDRMIMALLREDDIEEVYRRSLTDIGQFDGIKEECDFVVSNQINNNEFNHILTIQDLAKNIDELYKRRFTIWIKITTTRLILSLKNRKDNE